MKSKRIESKNNNESIIFFIIGTSWISLGVTYMSALHNLAWGLFFLLGGLGFLWAYFFKIYKKI
jgi:hypothetical protein